MPGPWEEQTVQFAEPGGNTFRLGSLDEDTEYEYQLSTDPTFPSDNRTQGTFRTLTTQPDTRLASVSISGREINLSGFDLSVDTVIAPRAAAPGGMRPVTATTEDPDATVTITPSTVEVIENTISKFDVRVENNGQSRTYRFYALMAIAAADIPMAAAGVDFPTDIDVGGGLLYAASYNNTTIRVFDVHSTDYIADKDIVLPLITVSQPTSNYGYYRRIVAGLALDIPNERLWVLWDVIGRSPSSNNPRYAAYGVVYAVDISDGDTYGDIIDDTRYDWFFSGGYERSRNNVEYYIRLAKRGDDLLTLLRTRTSTSRVRSINPTARTTGIYGGTDYGQMQGLWVSSDDKLYATRNTGSQGTRDVTRADLADLPHGLTNTESQFDLTDANDSPQGLAGDGVDLYVADGNDDHIYVYDIATEQYVGGG